MYLVNILLFDKMDVLIPFQKCTIVFHLFWNLIILNIVLFLLKTQLVLIKNLLTYHDFYNPLSSRNDVVLYLFLN